MNATALHNEIQAFCRANANEEIVAKSQNFFKETFDGYGLPAPLVRAKVKEMLRSKTIDLPVALEAYPLLAQSGMFEEISMGLLLVDGLHKQYSSETLATIEQWFSFSIYNWAHADTLGMFVLPHFIVKGIVSMEAFAHWLRSPYKFQRRCVPVTLIKPMKKTRQVLPYINFVEPLMNDTVREVHQGVGWFLREAWKIQPDETEAFLLKWKETAPRLIMQYACEKMTPDKKLLFKRSKK